MKSLFKRQLLKLFPLIITANFCVYTLPAIANSMPFSQTEIERELQTIPQWQQSEQTITRTFKFKNFPEAIAFVNRLVEPAEAAGHHPDLSIAYNKVTVALTTHDAGGLTDKDFSLAKTIADLAQQ